MRLAFRAVAALMAVFFVYATVVQHNDPDPLRWMALYVAAFGTSLGIVLGKSVRWIALVTAILGALWAAYWWSILSALADFGKIPWIEIEEARELGGLLIVTVWCAIVVLAEYLRRRVPQP